ncbi:phage tail assembly protein [Utexia brackfieldae]|uniref:phage tail assembly protein n=1 Tax=Utexia brackfieldae TaxID=3074108 RepID=UPI00370D219A
MTSLKEIKLSTPIVSGKNEITKVTVRKPVTGDLRGVKLLNFVDADIDSLAKVLPRISTPTLSEQDVYQMDLSDLTQFVVEISDFLKPTSNSVSEESPSE